MKQYDTTIIITDDDGEDVELEVTGWWLPEEGDGWNSPRYGACWEDIQIFKDGVELLDVSNWVIDVAEEALQEVLKNEHDQMLEDRAEARYNAMQDADEFYSSDRFNGGW